MSDGSKEKRFQSNVMLWSKTCPRQALMLPYLESKDVVFCRTDKGEENLLKRFGDKQIALHDQKGARDEAERWVAELGLKNDVPFVFVYGVGLGYYYDAIVPWLRKKRNRRVVFLEDDLAVVQKLFETERGTRILNDPQVQLLAFSDLAHDEHVFENLYWNFALTRLLVSSLKSYSEQKNSTLAELRHKIGFDASMKNALVDEYMRYGASFYLNFYRNMLFLDESYLGNAFFDKFYKVPAIICGAGPSLEKQLPLLKKVMDKAIVFAGGSALNVLNAAGLQPHFGAGIDPNPAQFARMSINQAYEVPFFYRNRMFHDAFRMIHGPRLYIAGAGGYDTADFFEEKLRIKGDALDEGHNVVNFCVEVAHAMGCDPLIFIGMDLAFTGMKEYAPGVVEDAAVTQSAILDVEDQDAKAVVRQDVNGNPTYTLWKWVAESEWIGDYAKEHPAIKMINCTEGGLGFPGIANRPFDEVVACSLSRVHELKDRVHGETQNSVLPKLTRRKVVKLMKELDTSLSKTIDNLTILSEDAANNIEKLKGGEETVSQSGLAALAETELADEPGYKHVLAVFNEVYTRILGSDLHQLQTRRYSPQRRLIKKLELTSRKFSFLRDVALANRELIAYSFRKLKEEEKGEKGAIPSYTQVPGTYLCANGRLVIDDEEADVKIDMAFVPCLIPEGGRVETDLGGGWHTRPLMDAQWKLRECRVEKDGVLDGQLQVYYPDGKVKEEMYYSQGVLYGPVKFWNPEGVLLAESWYVEGKQQGKSRWFYASGELYSIQRYKDGVWHGRQEYYYPGGQLKTLLRYDHGKIVGEPLMLDPDGTLYRHTIKGER